MEGLVGRGTQCGTRPNRDSALTLSISVTITLSLRSAPFPATSESEASCSFYSISDAAFPRVFPTLAVSMSCL